MSENGRCTSAVDGGGINASSITSFILCLVIKSNMIVSPFRCFIQLITYFITSMLQSSTKYFIQIYISCEIAHYGKGSVSLLQEFFAIIDKILILGGGLGTIRL